MMMIRFREYILSFLIVLGSVPSKFYDSSARLNLGLWFYRPTKIYHFSMYYINAITMLVLVWFLIKRYDINKRLLRVIFFIAILDFICTFIFSGKLLITYGLYEYGSAIKLCIAMIVETIYGAYKKYI